jgi:hypothetical protein
MGGWIPDLIRVYRGFIQQHFEDRRPKESSSQFARIADFGSITIQYLSPYCTVGMRKGLFRDVLT